MHIIVCIKQVPASNDIKIDRETNTLVRNGIESIINPFDLYALEEALRIKEKYGGKVTVISMGIPDVAKLLKETVAMGADETFLLSDIAFAGSDTFSTSYILSMGIKKIGEFDLIICGKQAIDGDTAQVGPGLAESLGIPHAACVQQIDYVSKSHIRCRRLMDNGFDIVEMNKPALITVLANINTPRNPSIKGIMKAQKAVVNVWNADDIEADKERCGLKGSPTKVIKTFSPEFKNNCEWLCGTSKEQTKELVSRLVSLNIKVN